MNYTNHIIFNFVCLIFVFIFHHNNPFFTHTQLTVFLLFYFLGTVFITPDLDANSSPSNKLGLIVYPYKKIFNHRGVSHHWLYGTFTRILYFGILFLILIIILNTTKSIPEIITILVNYKFEVLSATLGLFLSNLFHVIADYLS